MAEHNSKRVIVAGSSTQSRARLARIDISGDQVQVLERDYLDPALRSGRGEGTIAALGSIAAAAGATWLLAAVERGRPRLLDPESLGVIALLGRRREWRGAAEGRSPFLSVICDRAPVSVAGHSYMLTRSPRGTVDLLRTYADEPLERWCLGEYSTRVELLAGAATLVLIHAGKVARIDVDELVPGSCPLLDPRDVELALRWSELPRSVVGVCDLLDPAVLRVLEREGDRWRVTELELDGDASKPRASWPIEGPQRWLARAGQLWIASADAWTRIAAGHGPRERSSTLGGAMSPAAIESDGEQTWLWIWREDLGELWRIDGRTLAPEQRWPIALNLRPRYMLALAKAPAPEHSTVIHADELAELLPFTPELHETWPTWFDR